MKANFKHIRISPQKVRGIVNLVRGKQIDNAIAELRFCKKGGAKPVLKLVKSAVANAKQKGGIDLENLFVKTITVNNGPIMKRWKARSRGMAHRILKRSCHISVELGEK
jgi:large subunit ribosomal protein L22